MSLAPLCPVVSWEADLSGHHLGCHTPLASSSVWTMGSPEDVEGDPPPPSLGGLPGTQLPSGQPSLQDLLFGVPFCSPVPCGLGWGSMTALLCYQSGVLWFHSSLLTPLQMASSLNSEISHVSMLSSHWDPVGPQTTPTHIHQQWFLHQLVCPRSLVLPLGSGKWQTHWVL